MNKKIFMNSIQHRLSLLLIFTTTFVLTGFALVGYSTGKSEIKTELNGLTDFWTEQLSKTLKQPLWTFNYSIIEEIVNSTMLEKHIYAIIVRNVQGNFSSGKMRDDNWNIIEIGEGIPDNCHVGTGSVQWDFSGKLPGFV